MASIAAILLAAVLLSAAAESWAVFLLLFLPVYVCEEWLSAKLFSEKSPLNRLSTAQAGFSVWRILTGVSIMVPLLLIGLAVIFGFDFLLRLAGR